MSIDSVVATSMNIGHAGIMILILLALIAAAVAVVYLIRWAKGLYDDFTGPNAQIEEQIVNMFTPHNDEGTVDPIDIPPKGTDPVDWLFMHHELSEPV